MNGWRSKVKKARERERKGDKCHQRRFHKAGRFKAGWGKEERPLRSRERAEGRQTAGESRAWGGLGRDKQNRTPGTGLGLQMEVEAGSRAGEQGEQGQTLESLEDRIQEWQPQATGSRAVLGRQSWPHHVGGTEGSRR